MKTIRFYLLGLFIVTLLIPAVGQAQSRFKSRHLKSVDEARSQAIAGTLIPVAMGIGSTLLFENKTIETTGSVMAVYGLVMGPSMGNFYARDYLRGMLGVAARVGGGYLMLDATRELAGNDVADALGWDDEAVKLTKTKVLIGSGLILGSAIYNIVSAKASVHRYNEKKGYIIGVVPGVHHNEVIPMVTASVRF